METFGWEEVLAQPFHSAFFAALRILRWKIHFLVDPRAGEMGMNCEGVKRTGKTSPARRPGGQAVPDGADRRGTQRFAAVDGKQNLQKKGVKKYVENAQAFKLAAGTGHGALSAAHVGVCDGTR